MYHRRRVVHLGGLLLAGSVAGCSGLSIDGDEGPTSPSERTVEMTDGLEFEPREVSVTVGDTVVWETVGSVAHSVTAYEADLPDGAAYFASGEFETEAAAREAYPSGGSVGQDEAYSHTFETAGEFPYFCIPHEAGMRGTVIVEE
jgi:plastocyanin